MSEHKDYVSRQEEMGSIHISEEVLGSIAAAAALDVSSVSGLASHHAGVDLLGKRSGTKGVRIQVDEDSVSVEVSILMAYGSIIPEIAKAVQESVKSSIESMTGLTVQAVNVSVGGIIFSAGGGK